MSTSLTAARLLSNKSLIMIMKRNYIKPETKTLRLRLAPFLNGSLKGTTDTIDDQNLGEGGPDDQSREWGQKMWDDMD